jgi:hypothetical protein
MKEKILQEMFTPVEEQGQYSFSAIHVQAGTWAQSVNLTVAGMPSDVPKPYRLRAADLIDFAAEKKMSILSGGSPDKGWVAVRNTGNGEWDCLAGKNFIDRKNFYKEAD